MLTDFFFPFWLMPRAKEKQRHTCESRFHLAPPHLQQQCPAKETDSGKYVAGRPRTGRMGKDTNGSSESFFRWQHLTCTCMTVFFFLFSFKFPGISVPLLMSCSGIPGMIHVQQSSSIFWYHSLNSGFYFKTSPLFWRGRKPKIFLFKTVFSALGWPWLPEWGFSKFFLQKQTYLDFTPSSLSTARTARVLPHAGVELRESGNYMNSIMSLNTCIFCQHDWTHCREDSSDREKTLNQVHPFAPKPSTKTAPSSHITRSLF